MTAPDDLVFDAFLLAIVIYAHIAEYSEAQFRDSLPFVVKHLLNSLIVQNLREACYCFLSKQCLDAVIAKS